MSWGEHYDPSGEGGCRGSRGRTCGRKSRARVGKLSVGLGQDDRSICARRPHGRGRPPVGRSVVGALGRQADRDRKPARRGHTDRLECDREFATRRLHAWHDRQFLYDQCGHRKEPAVRRQQGFFGNCRGLDPADGARRHEVVSSPHGRRARRVRETESCAELHLAEPGTSPARCSSYAPGSTCSTSTTTAAPRRSPT